MIGFDEIFETLESKGTARYGGKDVSQLRHALQCAAKDSRAQTPTLDHFRERARQALL